MHRGRYDDAVTALKRFLADDRYQDREEIPDARNLLGRSLPAAEEVHRGPGHVAASTWPSTRPTRRGATCSGRSSTPST